MTRRTTYPAVTLGALLSRKIAAPDALGYVVAQIIGAILAAAVVLILTPLIGAVIATGVYLAIRPPVAVQSTKEAERALPSEQAERR